MNPNQLPNQFPDQLQDQPPGQLPNKCKNRPGTALLESHELTVEIAGQVICSELNFSLEPGQVWAMIGQNGVGKTTLMHTLAGLRTPQSGTVSLKGAPFHSLSRRQVAQYIGVMFQDDPDPFPHKVIESALIGRHPFLGRWQWESDDDVNLAKAALTTVALAPLQDRLVTTLSGGERRRLAMATLLTQDPMLFFLDEPTNHLDIRYQVALLNALTNKIQHQKAILMILHDVNMVARYCSHVMMLFGNGEVLCGPAQELLDTGLLARLYEHPINKTAGPSGTIFTPA